MNEDYVVDASALVDFIERERQVPVLEDLFENPEIRMHVPQLCDIEIAAALRKRLIAREIEEDGALDRLRQYASLPLERHDLMGFLPLILRWRKNFTAYDACYMVLAQEFSAPLVTTDRRLARAARQHSAVTIIDA